MCQYVYRTLAVGHHCAGHVYRTLAVVLHVTCTMRTSVTGPGMCTARWLLYYMYYAYLSYWTGHVYRTLACGCCHVMLWGVMTPHVPDELLFITIRNTF